MPVPAPHVTELHANLRRHEEKIERIEEDLGRPQPPSKERRLKRELRKHRTVVEMGKDPRLIPALSDILDSPAMRSQAMANPVAYARAKGVGLPPDTTVTIREFSPRIAVEATVGLGGFEVTVGYDSDNGFYGDVRKS